MIAWLIAVGAGALAFMLGYPRRPDRWTWIAATCRGVAAALLVALALDAPVSRGRLAARAVMVDGSASMARGGDALWRAALDSARAIGSGRVLVVEDTLRSVSLGTLSTPTSGTAAIGPMVDAALRDGVPVTVLTDGEWPSGSSDLLSQLPPGSRTVVLPRPAARDLSVDSVVVDEPVLAGDTLFAAVTVRNGATTLEQGRLVVRVGSATIERVLPTMAAWEQLRVALALPLGALDGEQTLVARAIATGDTETRNDSVVVRVVVTDQTRAVVAITAPDPDMRFALEAWRGALGERTRAYLRIAPGQWREASSLTPVAEGQVRARARAARTLILQGDTSWLGPLADVAAGGVVLVAPPRVAVPVREGEALVREEWFVGAAPASPIGGLLRGVAWDSLPPISVGATPASGADGGVLLDATAGRRGPARPWATWRIDGRRRLVTVAARGLSGWATRGGMARDAHDAFWGGIASWVAEAPVRAATLRAPAIAVRADAALLWSLPTVATTTDTLVVRSAAAPSTDVNERRLVVVRDSVARLARTAGLPAGDYVAWLGKPVGAPPLRFVVNPSSELLPAQATVRSAALPIGDAAGAPVGLTRHAAAFIGLVLLLCTEWLARRQAGLR